MADYLSNRQRKLSVGIPSYTENRLVLDVIGDATITGITSLASAGGITTTGGDLFIGGDLYVKNDITFDEATLRRIEVTESATIKNASITGVITSPTFVGNLLGNATYAASSGISTSVSGGTATVTDLTVSGGTTLQNVSIGKSIFDSSNSSGVNQYVLTNTPEGILWQAVTSSNVPAIAGLNVTTVSEDSPYKIAFFGVGAGTTAVVYVAPSTLTFNPSTNYLGIGTDNPTSRLTVDGDGLFTGTVTANKIIGDIDANTAIYASVAGIASYTTLAGVSSYSSIAGIATYALVAGIATVAENLTGTPNLEVGIVTATEYYGIFKGSIDAGVTLGNANYAAVAGIASYANVAGIATYANVAGIATYASISGIATYANVAGVATVSGGLTGTPNLQVGIVTATEYYGTFKGSIDADVTLGNANYAAVAGVATYAQTAGISTVSSGLTGTPNLEVGIVTATEYYGTFKGSIDADVTLGNANYAAVAGVATYASIAGVATYANIAGYSTSSGIATVAQGLTGTPNLEVGIVTATEYYGVFKGSIDADVTLGNANYAVLAGVSSYANVAGIATYASIAGIATYAQTAGISTVSGGLTGTPNLQVGIVTATEYYGVFKGSIDADVTLGNANYAVLAGIASYANVAGIATYANIAGVATYAQASGIATVAQGLTGTPNLQVGIVTATEYYGTFKGSIDADVTLGNANYAVLAGVSSYANVAGIATYAAVAGVATYAQTAGIATVAQGLTGTPNLQVGIVTATEYYGVFKGSIDADVTLGNANYAVLAGVSSYSNVAGIASYANVAGIASYANVAGVATYAQASGIATVAQGLTGTPNLEVGIVTATEYYGVFKGSIDADVTLGNANYAVLAGVATYATIAGVATYADVAGVSTSVIGGIGSITELTVSGISTLGTVTISPGIITASSGILTYYGDGSKLDGIVANPELAIGINTTNQNQFIPYATSIGSTTGLGVTNNLVYNPSSGNLGIGTTNPTSKLTVGGNVLISGITTLGTVQISSGIITASSGIVTYYGDGSQLSNIVAGVSISTNTTNITQFIPYATSIGSTTGLGVSESFVYNPSSGYLGIGTTNPTVNLHLNGDIKLDDGNSFSTTLEFATRTKNATVTVPNETGIMALVAGSSGQVTYNSVGIQSGSPDFIWNNTNGLTLAKPLINSTNVAASAPVVRLTGTWFSGTNSTSLPSLYVSPTGTSVGTDWNTAGSGIGVNATSGFTGDLLHLLINGTREWAFSGSSLTVGDANNFIFNTTTGTKFGTATNQKIGFFNATPVIQQTVTTDLLDSLQNLGLIASGAGNTPLDLTSGNLRAGITTLGITTVSSLSVSGVSTFANNVGIGTINPQVRLDVVGNTRITGVATITSNLDVTGGIRVGSATTLTVDNGDIIGSGGPDKVLGVSNVSAGGTLSLNTYSGVGTFSQTIKISYKNVIIDGNILGNSNLTLNDGSTYLTKIQAITPTENRTISLPDATGTVGLIAGTTGDVPYNNSGIYSGSSLGIDPIRQTFGYTVGGGTTTQSTSKTTGVTLNSPCGTITLVNSALAADTTESFTLTNSRITEEDMVLVSHSSVGTFGAYVLNARAGSGLANIDVRNVSTGSLSEAIVIRFMVIKATTS